MGHTRFRSCERWRRALLVRRYLGGALARRVVVPMLSVPYGEFSLIRTVLFIVVTIILWELFEYCIDKAIEKVCVLPYDEDEYPW